MFANAKTYVYIETCSPEAYVVYFDVHRNHWQHQISLLYTLLLRRMRTSTLLTVLQREGRSAACCTGRPIPPWLNTQERRNSSALNAETSVHLPLYRTSQIQSDHASSVLSILKCCSMQYSPRSCPCCSVSRDHKQNHALDSSSRLNFVPSAEAICKSWQSPWPLFWSETIYAIQFN
jgi:hypothetical protein